MREEAAADREVMSAETQERDDLMSTLALAGVLRAAERTDLASTSLRVAGDFESCPSIAVANGNGFGGARR
jgi:hypothetical protein